MTRGKGINERKKSGFSDTIATAEFTLGKQYISIDNLNPQLSHLDRSRSRSKTKFKTTNTSRLLNQKKAEQ